MFVVSFISKDPNLHRGFVDQKEPKLDLETKELDKKKDTNDKKVLYFTKVIKPTPEEKNDHSNYLKTNLKKNFFN